MDSVGLVDVVAVVVIIVVVLVVTRGVDDVGVSSSSPLLSSISIASEYLAMVLSPFAFIEEIEEMTLRMTVIDD